MLSFYFISVLFFINTVNGNHLEKITSIKGTVQSIDIDSDSNIYVTGKEGEFYKLNSKHEIILNTTMDSPVHHVFITPSQSIWIVSNNNIYSLKPNSTHIDNLTKYYGKVAFAMDTDGNLIYNTEEGVSIFKVEATTPMLILNLEYFNIGGEGAFSVVRSNIYSTGRLLDDADRKIAMIPSDQLKYLAPSAYIIDGPSLNLKLDSQCMFTEFDKKVVAAYSGKHARLCTIESCSNCDSSYKLRTIYPRPSFWYYKFHFVQGYLYFLGTSGENCYLNFIHITSNSYHYYGTKQINREFEKDLCTSGKMLSDDDGNLFLASSIRLYRLKVGEVDIYEIEPFNKLTRRYRAKNLDVSHKSASTDKIYSLDLDKQENMWILGRGELYYLQKNSTVADKVTNSSLALKSGILKVNKKTKEILIGSENRFYVFSK